MVGLGQRNVWDNSKLITIKDLEEMGNICFGSPNGGKRKPGNVYENSTLLVGM